MTEAATICGKCGHFVDVCMCQDIIVSANVETAETGEVQTPEEQARIHELVNQVIEFDKFRAAFDAKTAEHRVKTDDKRNVCPTCTALKSTFGCLKCNRGTTKVSW
jgi:hypothetical protein